MKKHAFFLFAALLAAAAILGLTACGSPTNPGGGGGGTTTTTQTGVSFSVSGTFDRNSLPGEDGDTQKVRFKLTDEANYGGGRAAVTANSFAVKGELEDGDVVYRLKGTYDPDKLNYSVSADSSHIRYSINGLVDSEGKSAGSTATLLVKTDPENKDTWTAHTFVIEEPVGELNIDTSDVKEENTENEFPPVALGRWKASDYTPAQDGFPAVSTTVQLLINGWNLNFSASTRVGSEAGLSQEQKMLIVEFEEKGGYYDIIIAYPEYTTDVGHEGEIIKAFLASKGIYNVTALTEEPNPNDPNNYPTGPAFYINQQERSSSWYNFTQSQWPIVDAYFMTNHLEKILIAEGVEPTTLFEKGKVVFSGDTKMEYASYGKEVTDGNETYFTYVRCETASEAKALTVLDSEGLFTFTRQ